MKIVPDPPTELPPTVLHTAQTPFCSCHNAHASLFQVHAGILAEDALAQISRHLQSATETAGRAHALSPFLETTLQHSTLWSIGTAQALVDALRKSADPMLRQTAALPFKHFDAGDSPMFSVRSGVLAEDVLVHVSLCLQAAYATADEVCVSVPQGTKGLHWATLNAIEMALGLTEALLDGAEGL